jgi:O-acetyl-ADP-ribose deacetylase
MSLNWRQAIRPDSKIVLWKGDITQISVDAVVNAANSSLLGGGGVDGAIHRAGGPAILASCQAIREQQGECAPGDAVVTTAGKLPVKYVIHAVGPVWKGGQANEAALLAGCYQKSLELAVEHNCHTIAFPGISTGVYGYPKEEAARVALATIQDFLSRNNRTLQQVLLVVFDDESYRIYEQLLNKSEY